MKMLHDNGIFTATFISPIFPAITVVEDIVHLTKNHCDVYWLENLNLRGSYKKKILDYVAEKYPQHIDLYNEIYMRGNKRYWVKLSERLEQYAVDNDLNMINYFYHELIRKT